MFYLTGPMFWIKIFLVLVILFFLLFAFNIVMSRLLKVEKRKLFSNNHVNEKHKKIDWTIRIILIIALYITFVYTMSNPDQIMWYFQPGFILLGFVIISQIAKAMMEWKYAVNRRVYVFTISEIFFVIILISVIYGSNFFPEFYNVLAA